VLSPEPDGSDDSLMTRPHSSSMRNDRSRHSDVAGDVQGEGGAIS